MVRRTGIFCTMLTYLGARGWPGREFKNIGGKQLFLRGVAENHDAPLPIEVGGTESGIISVFVARAGLK